MNCVALSHTTSSSIAPFHGIYVSNTVPFKLDVIYEMRFHERTQRISKDYPSSELEGVTLSTERG